MLNFIKKLFQKEEPVKIEEVKADELPAWLDSKLSGIDFKEEIIEFFNEIKDNTWILDEKIEALEKAEIDEKGKAGVEEKVKNVVLGHKENYAREMKRFLENLSIPEEYNLQEAIRFNDFLNNSLDELSKKTAKSYQVAQHLFFKQVEEVFEAVGEINLLLKNFNKKLEEKSLKKIKEIKEKIGALQEEKRRKEKLEDELKWKAARLEKCLEGTKKQEEETLKLRNCEEYQEFLALKEEEENVNSLAEENKNEIYLFFSKLNRSLRKYEKVALEIKLVQDYLEDTVKSFFNDSELKIVGVLEELGKSIVKGEVKLDSKEKRDAFELIEKAKKGCLKELLEKGKELQGKTEAVKIKFRGYTIDKLIEEAEYKSEHFEEQTVLVKREIEELKVKLRALDSKKVEEELKELVKEVLKVNLVIN